jgi:hypothetical protein
MKWEPAPVDKYHRWIPVGSEERRQTSDIIGRLHVDLAYIAMLRATGGYTDFIQRMAPKGYQYDVEVQPNDRRGGYDITYFKVTPAPVAGIATSLTPKQKLAIIEAKMNVRLSDKARDGVKALTKPHLDFWNDPQVKAEIFGTDLEEWSRRGFYRIVNSFRSMS